MKVSYVLSRYISHRKAGLAYLHCLRLLGIEVVNDLARADVVILHDEPWIYPSYFEALPELKHKLVVGYAVWETDHLPAGYRTGLSSVHEVWTASSYSRRVLKQCVDRVFVVPHVVEAVPSGPEVVARIRERIQYREGELYFYSITKTEDPRKNFGATLRAFDRISGIADVRLIVKTTAGSPVSECSARSVTIVSDLLTESEIQALHETAHCFISSHCAEGWGLGITEAMAHGNMAIATAFGGNMDYMREDNSSPVKFSLGPIRDEACATSPTIWSSRMKWAYIDEDDLFERMKIVCTDWNSTEKARKTAKADMRKYSPIEVSRILAERLRNISYY